VNRTSKDKGLTTVELFIVIAILGILISMGLSWVFYHFDPFERGFRRMMSDFGSRRHSHRRLY
jgi:hypothetical protein